MDTLKKWFKNKWFRRVSFVMAGALVGFSYYYFIGCATKTCPITANPYMSIGYGSLMGLVLSGTSYKTNTNKSAEPENK